MESQTDDFYFAAITAKREGQKNFNSSHKIADVKSALSTKNPVHYDEPALGAVRLRHSSTSQPLVPGDNDFDFIIPFDKNERMLEILWNYLLKLEDVNRQENPSPAILNNLVRFLVHSLQFDATSDAVTTVHAEDHQRFAYYLNNHKGQRFLSRFLDLMPSSFLKRFFFTSFIVFESINIDSSSPFAIDFLKRLVDYLKEEPKAKWLAAFIKQSTAGSFVSIASSNFKFACVATLLTAAQARFSKFEAGEVKMIQDILTETTKRIIKELATALKQPYNQVFMKAVLTSITFIVPKSELSPILVSASI